MAEKDKPGFSIRRKYLRTNGPNILVVRLNTNGYKAVEKDYPKDVLKKNWKGKKIKWLANFFIKDPDGNEVAVLKSDVTYDIEIDMDDLELGDETWQLVWYVDGKIEVIPGQKSSGRKIIATGLNRGDPPIGISF